MRTFEIKNMPQIRFAHVHHADSYLNTFPVRRERMEVTYISEGSVQIECDGKEYTARKGDIICQLYYPHQITIRASAYHEHHTVQAILDCVRQQNTSGLYLPVITPAHYNTKAAANLIDKLICNQLLFKDSPTKGAILFLDLLYEIDQCNRKAEKPVLPGEVLYTQRAKEYVQNHLREVITQKNAAEYLSISPEYLCAVFKKTEGMTFMKYVNTEKLEAIRNLMEKEHLRLYEAAALLGYNDPNYVSRLFKKYYSYNITDRQSHSPTRKTP